MQSLTNLCLSGGAEGADLQFGMTAGRAGHAVKHFIFEGHRSRAPHDELVVLNVEQLAVANDYVAQANRSLKRRWPVSSSFVSNLLRRNYYQVAWTESVYAISTFDKLKKNVNGGTAWAVQMFLDRFDGKSCPAYVFDQKGSVWYCWEGEMGWRPLCEWKVPRPEGIWAGIGTRDLNEVGKKAIRRLLDYHP